MYLHYIEQFLEWIVRNTLINSNMTPGTPLQSLSKPFNAVQCCLNVVAKQSKTH